MPEIFHCLFSFLSVRPGKFQAFGRQKVASIDFLSVNENTLIGDRKQTQLYIPLYYQFQRNKMISLMYIKENIFW